MKKIIIVALVFVAHHTMAQVSESKKNATQKPGRYSIPLYFHPDSVGVKKVTYQLSWDLSQKDTLKLGSLSLNADNFVPAFFPANSKNHPLAGMGEGVDKDTLFLIWPTSLVKSGTLEMIARDGSVLWSDTFDVQDAKNWRKKVQSIKLQIPAEKQKENKIFFNSGIALTDLSSDLLSKINGSFRFCLSEEKGKERSMLCSPKYAATKINGELSLGKIIEEADARILVDREEVPKVGQKDVTDGQVVSFFGETSGGMSYEFTTRVLPVQIFDIFKDVDGAVLVSGVDPVPFGAGIYEGKNDDDNYWNNHGWQQTIGDLRSYWQMQLPANKELTVPGRVGGAFRVQLDYIEVPDVTQRVWVSAQDIKATYSEKKALHLYHSEKQKIQGSFADEVTPNPLAGPGEVIWNFPAPRLAEYNLANIDILTDSKSTKGSYEIYRGRSSELSGRFTAALDKNLQSIILGEVSYNKWFQDLWGWDNDTWSTLRWGVSAKYFKSLNSIDVKDSESTTTTKSDLSVMSVLAKYRFNPGLWGRDETWGLLGGYESLSIAEVKVPVLGMGFYWARSMPKIFDDLFSYLPFMDHPKFVDMEFIYLPLSLDSNVTVGSSYLISFHGKVLWSQTIFGEAGFGLQSYSLQDKAQSLSVGLSAFYLTVGLGINF